MKLGVCTGPDQWITAAEAGFDYIECPLNRLAAMNEEEYQAVLKMKNKAPIPLSACNCLLPSSIKVCGPTADESEQRAYLSHAFSRAQALGVSVVVFGSGGSRQVPPGFAFDQGWRQIISFLRLAGECAERYNLDIVIEPLRRQECNILNYVSEAVLMAAVVDHPRVYVLGDTFHMISSSESWEALSQAGSLLRHIHVSHALPGLTGRCFPAPDDGEDYAELFKVLKEMRYAGNVSVEASTENFLSDSKKAVQALRRAISG